VSVEILYDPEHQWAGLVCTTSDALFGPLFRGADARDQAEAFLEWLPWDARRYTKGELELLHRSWLDSRAGEEIAL